MLNLDIPQAEDVLKKPILISLPQKMRWAIYLCFLKTTQTYENETL